MTDTPSTTGVDATWAAQAADGDWNTATNWSPAEVATGTANFATSTTTAITFAAGSDATVNAITFAEGAAAFTFTFSNPAPDNPALTIAGAGVSSSATLTQQFVIASSATTYKEPQLKFTNSASAGGNGITYAVGPASPTAKGGGVLGFYDTATAGSAAFIVTTGSGTPPKENSTVGGEVSFSDASSADRATFTIYGSTSTTDGDTFGNVVFHDTATAASATFTNAGGTVSGGDGGNTQFYNSATAAGALFQNKGGTVAKANGGDVAFDGTSSAAGGTFHNYAASTTSADGGYGGVTSFNNNWPYMEDDQGASAGSGSFYNYGAKAAGQGGGHTFFTGKYGSASGDRGNFVNYGAAVASSSHSVSGHTVFSISLPWKEEYVYRPSAGNATITNHPGSVDGAPGGYTEFTVYTNDGASAKGSNGPGAGSATITNLGATIEGASGGTTTFGGTAGAESAQLIAHGGSNGGGGGTISFSDWASGDSAYVQLSGNAMLDLSYHYGELTIATLYLWEGTIKTQIGEYTTTLSLSEKLELRSDYTNFSFYMEGDGAPGEDQSFVVLRAPNLSDFSAEQFQGSSVGGAEPSFWIDGTELKVSFK